MRRLYFYLSLMTLLVLAAVGAHMSSQTPPGAYTSPALGGGGVCGNCLTNNPTGTNQTITPGDTTSIPLTIKEASGTTATSDFQVISSASANVFSVSPAAATDTFTFGTGSTLISFTGWGGSGFTLGTSTGPISLGTRTLKIGNDTFTHVNINSANNDFAGKLTCATSTVTKTFALAFTSTPTIVLSDETTAGGARASATSNSAFTVTCTGATDVVDYIVIGNPN